MQSADELIKMFDQNFGETLKSLTNEYDRLCNLLTYQEVLLDKKLFLNYEKQKNILEPIVLQHDRLKGTIADLTDLNGILNSVPENEKKPYNLELDLLLENVKTNISTLTKMINQIDAKQETAIIEVIANKDQSTNVLFNDLLTCYQAFCAKNNLEFKLETIKSGAKLNVAGLNALKSFSAEAGIHKLLLKNGQEHTCQVYVYEKYSSQVLFNEADVEFKASRSSGAGGQHVNTTDSSIRATHIPTGISVVCEDERSQLQNKVKALENLKQKVQEVFETNINSKIEKQKKEQIKKMKNNFVVKTYFKDDNKIEALNKTEILYADFLNGTI